MSETAAAVRHLSDGIRDAVLSRPGGHVLVHALPDLSLQHAAMSVRTGGRILRRLGAASKVMPGLFALVCWFAWAYLQSVSQSAAAAVDVVTTVPDPTKCVVPDDLSTCSPLLDAHGTAIVSVAKMTSFAGPAALAATWFRYGAVFCAIGALTLAVSNASRRRRDKRLQWARRFGKDWKASKRDARRANRRLARIGRSRQGTWERQWAHERSLGASEDELTTPGRVDRALLKRVQPKKAKRKAGAARTKKARKASRVEALEAEAEWQTELARIDSRQAAETVALVNGPPRAGHDPAASPVAPNSTAGQDPQQRAWRERSKEIEAETTDFLASLQPARHGGIGDTLAGYEPWSAPVNGNGSAP